MTTWQLWAINGGIIGYCLVSLWLLNGGFRAEDYD